MTTAPYLVFPHQDPQPDAPLLAERTLKTAVILGFNAHMLAFARRAQQSGIRVHLIDLVRKPRAFVRLSNALDPEGIVMEWTKVDTPEGLEIVHRFAAKVGAEAILTSDDSALLWLGKNRARFEPACTVLAPDHGQLLKLLDKALQIDCATRAGFDVLPGWLITSPEMIRLIPGHAYPVVIRPSAMFSAHPTFKAKILSTRQALVDLYTSTRWTQPPIVQRYCFGPNYILHGIRAQSGQILEMRLFRAYRKYKGLAASIEPAALPPALERAARRFAENEGITGAFHFDLLRAESDDTFYFLEVNCRLGGTTLRVIQLGYDEPNRMLAAFGLRPARLNAPLEDCRQATSLSLSLQQACNDLLHRPDPLAYPQISPLRSAWTALKEALSVRDSLLSTRDLLSCLRYAWWHGK